MEYYPGAADLEQVGSAPVMDNNQFLSSIDPLCLQCSLSYHLWNLPLICLIMVQNTYCCAQFLAGTKYVQKVCQSPTKGGTCPEVNNSREVRRNFA